ncbi:MAG TPA: superoxide dismutase [Myxococcales bacterium]|nr:superoxide dismutase [Myxococcales bacterium]
MKDVSRREFLEAATVAGAAVIAGALDRPARAAENAAAAAPFALPPLPYAENALEPFISSRTMGFHYGKHHKGYVAKLNKAVAGTALATKTLEQLVTLSAGKPDQVSLFDNAAQTWNHTFYWHSMRPSGGGAPTGALRSRIEKSFGSVGEFQKQFAAAAGGQFGSGWAWLIQDGERLAVVKTADADNPLSQGKKALLCCDVWEHAYYLDYQNRRPDYVKAFLDHLANWEFVEQNLAA